MRRHESFRARAACLALAAVILVPALTSCSGGQGRSPSSVASPLVTPAPGVTEAGGRVSPVYEQWLYKQSMLGQARDLVATVSASSRLWRHTAAIQDKDVLRQAAPTWTQLSPTSLPGRNLSSLADLVPTLAQLGLRGLWLGQINEGDAAWVPETAQDRIRCASLRPAPGLGSEEDLRKLVATLGAGGLQSGMDLVPAATGLGSDFMLQARGSERHQGTYVLLEVPQRLWSVLPEATQSWECRLLDAAACRTLMQEGILPGPLRQEAFLPQATWAVTGKVLGVDGQTRRLIYRTLSSPWQPILCWQDPAGAARTLLAGSIVSVTGLRRQTLAGISLTGLAGLDRADAPSSASPTAAAAKELLALTPAPTALADLSQQIRRYGGWSLLLDSLSLPQTEALQGLADFMLAPQVSEALLAAWQNGDASTLAKSLRSLQTSTLTLKDLVFAAPAPTNVQSPRARMSGTDAADTAPLDRREMAARNRHLLAALPAGLPGLCFLEAGGLFDRAGRSGAEQGTAALLLTDALQARQELDLASGRLVQVLHPARGVLVTTSALPGGGLFVTALNFSDSPVTQTLSLPAGCSSGQARSLTPQVPDPAPASPDSLALSLKARQAAHFLVGLDAGRYHR